MRQALGPGALGRPEGLGGEGSGRGDRNGALSFQCMTKSTTKKNNNN